MMITIFRDAVALEKVLLKGFVDKLSKLVLDLGVSGIYPSRLS